MPFAFTRRHALALGLTAAIAGLTACGGGSSDSGPSWAELSGSNAVTAAKTTEIEVGTGLAATTGKTLTVHYTGWLYDVRVATTNKGQQFDTSVGKTPLVFKMGAGQVITGFDQAFVGMKVGGKRNVVFPASQGYGNSGSGAIPPGAALIFEVQLVGVAD